MPVIAAGTFRPGEVSPNPSPIPAWVLLVITAGEGTLICDDAEYNLSPGTVICLPPGAEYTVTEDGKEISAVYVKSTELIPVEIKAVLRTEDTNGELEAALRLICGVLSRREAYFSGIVSSLQDAVQQMVLRLCGGKPGSHNVERMIELLTENYTNPEYRVSDAVDIIPFCSDYIRRQFKSEMGVTPIMYLSQLRLEYAKRLLRQQGHTRRTIAEISYMCGFYDPRYFSRLFKKHTGMTPKEFAETV